MEANVPKRDHQDIVVRVRVLLVEDLPPLRLSAAYRYHAIVSLVPAGQDRKFDAAFLINLFGLLGRSTCHPGRVVIHSLP